jgi:hypothetical protein
MLIKAGEGVFPLWACAINLTAMLNPCWPNTPLLSLSAKTQI